MTLETTTAPLVEPKDRSYPTGTQRAAPNVVHQNTIHISKIKTRMSKHLYGHYPSYREQNKQPLMKEKNRYAKRTK